MLSSQKQQVLGNRQQFLDVRTESRICQGGSCALTLLTPERCVWLRGCHTSFPLSFSSPSGEWGEKPANPFKSTYAYTLNDSECQSCLLSVEWSWYTQTPWGYCVQQCSTIPGENSLCSSASETTEHSGCQSVGYSKLGCMHIYY